MIKDLFAIIYEHSSVKGSFIIDKAIQYDFSRCNLELTDVRLGNHKRSDPNEQ